MAKKSLATRRAIAGSSVNVALDARLSFNEAAALRWAIDSMRRLALSRVVTLPKQHDGVFWTATDTFIERLGAAVDWAEAAIALAVDGGELPTDTVRAPDTKGVRRCRVCGCTDDDCRQCIAVTGRPCHWVAPDLCSACVLPAEPSTPPAAIGDQAKFRFRRVGTRRPGQRKRGRRTAAAAAAGGGYV